MFGYVNKAIVVGNSAKDVEVRSTQGGERIGNLTVATEESWVDKGSGERKKVTEWHRVVVFNSRILDVLEKYAPKGTKLYVEGKIKTRKWTDQSGVEKFSTEIVVDKFNGEIVILSDKQGGAAPARSTAPAKSSASARHPSGGGFDDDLNQDIPF